MFFFVILGVPKAERKSWVVWEEWKDSNVIIEPRTQRTAKHCKNEKKVVYQDRLRVLKYFWYDPFNPENWSGFFLKDGNYESLYLDMGEKFFSQRLGLAVIPWQAGYK